MFSVKCFCMQDTVSTVVWRSVGEKYTSYNCGDQWEWLEYYCFSSFQNELALSQKRTIFIASSSGAAWQNTTVLFLKLFKASQLWWWHSIRHTIKTAKFDEISKSFHFFIYAENISDWSRVRRLRWRKVLSSDKWDGKYTSFGKCCLISWSKFIKSLVLFSSCLCICQEMIAVQYVWLVFQLNICNKLLENTAIIVN